MEQQPAGVVASAASAAGAEGSAGAEGGRSAPRLHRRLGYVAPIDGMRGLGVLIVMAYHSGVPRMQGAFLCIDMFFTTSAFLITTILLREVRSTGRIGLLEFWKARARRLLPALLGMLLLASAYAKWFADPSMVRAFRGDILSALFFVSNWRFVRDDQSYFGAQATMSPVLHTWSLGIEEQFYLLWPLALLAWMWWRRGSTRHLGPALLALALGATIYTGAAYKPGLDPSHIYYNTFARGGALAIGAALAVYLHRQSMARKLMTGSSNLPPGSSMRDAFGLLCLGFMLAVPFFATDDATWVFDFGFLLVGLASAALIQTLVTSPSAPVSRLLANRLLTNIGRRTYGLYVWHWPIFLILSPERTGWDPIPLIVLRIAVTFAVAYAFDRYVERPVRRGLLRSIPRPRARALVVGAIAGTAAVAIAATSSAQAAIFGTGLPGNVATVTGPMRPGQTKIVVVGDSVGLMNYVYFPRNAYADLSVGTATQLGCGIALPQRFWFGAGPTKVQEQCEGYDQRWSAVLDKVHPQVVILDSVVASVFDYAIDGKRLVPGTPEFATFMTAAFDRAVDVAGAKGRYPVLLANVPCYERADKLEPGALDGWGLTEGDFANAEKMQNDLARGAVVNGILDDVAGRHPNVSILDANSFLCHDGKPVDRIDGIRLRPDGVHVTRSSAPLWWKHFLPEIRRVAKEQPGVAHRS